MERNALSEDAPFHSQTMRLFSGSVIAAGHQHGHDGVVVVISGLDAFGKLHVAIWMVVPTSMPEMSMVTLAGISRASP